MEFNGYINATSAGILGFTTAAGNPDPTHNAFFFGFVDGIQNHGSKGNQAIGVRCTQALPK